MGSSYIHYAESSMKNGFGLKYLHRFFNIPFLQLQVTFYRHITFIWLLDPVLISNFCVCLSVSTEGNAPEAAGDQPTRHGCHSGGTLCPAGDWRSKLWDVQCALFFFVPAILFFFQTVLSLSEQIDLSNSFHWFQIKVFFRPFLRPFLHSLTLLSFTVLQNLNIIAGVS